MLATRSSNVFYFASVIGNASLVSLSRQYRSVMRDCQQQLDAEAEISATASDQVQAEAYVQQSELLYKLELIWNLVEVVCIEKTASKSSIT
jgi:hypothetical protein